MIRMFVFVTLGMSALRAQDPGIDAVRGRERELEEALVHADVGKLQQMLTSDFLRTPPSGRDTDKAAWTELIGSGQLKYQSFEDRGRKYRAYRDTVLVNALTHLRYRSGAGADRGITLKLLWVWVKQDGQWLVAAVQGNEVAAPGSSVK